MQFFNLWDRMFRKPDTPMYNPLTSEQVKILKELTRHPGWHLYVEAVDRYTVMLAESLLVEADSDRVMDLRSEIRGLRNAPLLVAQVIQTEELNDEQQRSLARAFSGSSATRFDTGPYTSSSGPAPSGS